jgi:hypothetical protein
MEKILMKPSQTKLVLAFFGIASLITIALAQTQSRAVLGKNDYTALIDAAPGVPATAAEAGKRAYGADIRAQNEPVALEVFYAPFNKQVEASRAVIKGAVANQERDQQALAQRTVAQANASPLISRMGGVEKMSQMSEEELKQAAAQAVGSYTQSLSGAPTNAPGGGMQAMMQRLMSDPAYQARFEKMSKAEQEAELQKYMGNANVPAPPTGETAAERNARHATAESAAVVARQKELGALMQQLGEIDVEFKNKDKVILATPGGYDEIRKEIHDRIEKLPIIGYNEAGAYVDPVKFQALQREGATRARARATWELQQRTLLYNQTKSRYKEVASAYSTWVRNSLGGVSSQNAQLLDDATVIMAVKCEEELIKAAENLGKHSADATSLAAGTEKSYVQTMSEPLAKPLPSVK